MRILIVDDASVLRANFGRLATRLGHEIAGEAATPQDARRLAGLLLPDAVVVDGRLPGADVVALVADLCAALPQTRVFVIAALEETQLVRSAVAAGAAGAVRRPFSLAQIQERLCAEGGAERRLPP